MEQDAPARQPLSFPSGQIVMTAAINGLCQDIDCPLKQETLCGLLSRHLAGDWGDVQDDSVAMNDESVRLVSTCDPEAEGRNILSSYEVEGVEIWIITDFGNFVVDGTKSAIAAHTTVLLPEDY